MMARGHPCWPRTRAILCASLWCVAAVAEAAGRPVTLTSVDGVPLAGAFFEARNGPASGVVLVHMLGRTKDDWQDLGNRLQQAGLNALAIDLRGHGQSGGSAARLAAMGGDVRAAVEWLQTRPSVQSDRIGIAGASLGANLALMVAVGVPSVRALAMLSPALDYRGVRIDAAMLRRYGARPAWLAASTEDPYALRTLRELGTDTSGSREQRLTTAVAHGTNMLTADTSLSPELVDWLARTLIF
jgi:alpha-beta hydrolase superfamily lysophospholipase